MVLPRAVDLIKQSAETLARVCEENGEAIERAAEALYSAFRGGHRLLVCGNGGSAADAQHIAAEFVGRYLHERTPLPAYALTTNTSSLTAISNDYGYEQVFARQVEAFGASGDVFWGISTSGNSRNVVEAAAVAKRRGLYCLGLTGAGGGQLGATVDLCICVPSSSVPRIQEAHIAISHVICELVESALVAGR
jgi:D-sedoheptulose 7-phosphate isomerase